MVCQVNDSWVYFKIRTLSSCAQKEIDSWCRKRLFDCCHCTPEGFSWLIEILNLSLGRINSIYLSGSKSVSNVTGNQLFAMATSVKKTLNVGVKKQKRIGRMYCLTWRKEKIVFPGPDQYKCISTLYSTWVLILSFHICMILYVHRNGPQRRKPLIFPLRL